MSDTFKEQLGEMDACDEAIEWIGNKDLQTAWQTCERADWMLWLAAEMMGHPGWSTHKEIVAVCCDIAESVLHFVPEGDDRPRVAIETTRRWIAGEATLDDVLRAARAADDASDAAADAADAAWATASYAAWAASDAARAAASSDAAWNKKHIEMCEMIREKLTIGEMI